MDPETVAWVLLALGVVLAAVPALLVVVHLRRLTRARVAATADVTRRVARLQLLAAARPSRAGSPRGAEPRRGPPA